MRFQALRSDVAFTCAGSFSRLVSTPGGGTGGGVPGCFRESICRATPERFGSHGRHRQHAALPEQAAARAVRSSGDAAEVAAMNIRDAVVPREPLVDERVVGVEQVDDAAVFADDAVERASRSRAGTPGAGCRRSSSPTVCTSASSRR